MTILLVEDNLDIATAIVEFLEVQGFLIDHAGDSEQALKLIQKNIYQLLILDLNLPQKSCLQICQQAKKEKYNLPLILLAPSHLMNDDLDGFVQQADGYITKPFDLRVLAACIDVVIHRYTPWATTSLFSYKDLELIPSSNSVICKGQKVTLEPIDYTILKTLVSSAPNIVSPADLQAAICIDSSGDERTTDENVLRNHVSQLKDLINKSIKTGLLQVLPRVGYRIA